MSKNRSPIDRLDAFGEDTVLGLSIKSLIAVGVKIATMVSMYMTLQADISVAMEQPKSEVSRTEFDLQTKMMDKAIISTKEDISEIKESIDKLDRRLFQSR